MLPQLRVRTEFAFRRAYGPLKRVAAALEALDTPVAAIVDGGTWGHVRWRKTLGASKVRPAFGRDFALRDGPRGAVQVPWALMRKGHAADFYRLSSAFEHEPRELERFFKLYEGQIIRFRGTSTFEPEAFDFIDVNPGSRREQRIAVELHRKTGIPLVITSDNYYPAPADLNPYMLAIGQERMTPQHILTTQELRAALPELSSEEFARALGTTLSITDDLESELPTAPLIDVPGDFRALVAAGKRRRIERGHIRWTDEYEARMNREIEVIELKAFQSYFIVVSDLVMWAKERMLVGPGRGSSAGSLVCYLIGITEVDPIPHGLLFERFIDLTRKDLPDIDIDFSDKRRELCFEYLAEKYGARNVARLGNINTMKPKTVLNKACEQFGIPDGDKFNILNVLIEHSSGDSRFGRSLEDTLTLTDYGEAFVKKYPAASATLTEVENHASHTGVHAAGVIVSNVPVDEFCTVGEDGVAQIDKPDAEALNLLKIDALGLRTLGIIEDANVTTPDALYGLSLDEPAAFDILNSHKFSGIFQFEGQAQRSISSQVVIDSFKTMDHVTALARPGPLGGGASAHYVQRKAGKEPITTTHPRMMDILADTYGVVLYQEQVMRIVREIGRFSWEDTTTIRKAMSGRKGKEYFDLQGEKFIEGAALDNIDRKTADQIWYEMCSFGAWGMNKSHTCAYAIISYWCAWIKAHYPLEFAAACLRNAKDEEQTIEILRELDREGVKYTPFDIDKSDVDWAAVDGQLVGGFKNLKGFGNVKASKMVLLRNAGKLTAANRAAIEKAEVRYTELYPIRRQYEALYTNPEAFGCRAGSRIATGDALPDSGDVLYLGKLYVKKRRDENEAVIIAKRNGRRTEGPTLFADFHLRDDTGVPVICRVDRFKYQKIARKLLEELREGEDVLLIRGRRVPNFPMIQVERIKCLTREIE